MKKAIIGGVTLGGIIIFFILSNEPPETLKEEQGVLGYCPTQREDALSFAEKNNLETVLLGSTGEALFALNSGEVDFAMVGRKAEKGEINKNIDSVSLREGYTLVHREGEIINAQSLRFFEINTHLKEEDIINIPLFGAEINYYKSKEEVVDATKKAGQAALISWSDWEDDFNLLIVMDGRKKVKAFRGNFLYFHDNLYSL